MALLICELFEAWKRDSWEAVFDPLTIQYCPYFYESQPDNTIPVHQQINVLSFRHCQHLNVSKPEYAIPEHQQIKPLARRHCLFQNVSQPEYAIPVHQQTNHIAGQNCLYLNVSHPENSNPKIRKWTILQDGTPHNWIVRNLKPRFLRSSKSTPCMRQYSNLTNSRLKSRFLGISKSTPLQDCSANFWTFHSLNTRFLIISKTTSLLDSTALIWYFRTLEKRFLSIRKSTLLLDGNNMKIIKSSTLQDGTKCKYPSLKNPEHQQTDVLSSRHC